MTLIKKQPHVTYLKKYPRGIMSRTIIKLFLFTILIAGFSSSIFAMGGDSSDEKSIPLPPKNFTVSLTDAQGVETKADRISWDGKIYIQGRRGEALTTVPFEKINQITLLPDEKAHAGSIASKITLKSGEEIRLDVKATSKAFGETSFGKFEIYMRDIRTVKFQ